MVLLSLFNINSKLDDTRVRKFIKAGVFLFAQIV
jgi:hypothetical protein